MIFLFCRKVCFMRLFGRIEIPKMNSFSVASYRSRPLFGLLGFCKSKSSTVLSIQCWVGFSQICNSVVRSISVYMVNHFWQKSIRKKESNSMGIQQFSIYSKNNISIFVACANWVFNICNGKKQACIRVVIDMLKIIFVHAVVLSRQWFEKWRQGLQSLFSAPFYQTLKGKL